MAFEDSPLTGTGSRYLGEGFRQEPDFREGTTTIDAVGTPAAPGGDPTVTLGRRAVTPNLDYVFDDPADGEPGRDRMLVHGLWELVLAIALAGLGYLLYRADSGTFTGDGFRTLLLNAAVLGILAAAVALSLRVGAVNLAVGAVAVAGGLYFAEHSDGGLLQPLLVVIGLTAAVGAVQGLVVVGLQVPGWAAGIGAALAVWAWSVGHGSVAFAGYDARPDAYWWFGGFCAASLIFGVAGLFPTVRRALGRFRPVADPAYRRGLIAALITFAATVVSSILAGVAGVLVVAVQRSAVASDGLSWTALALGAALLGGTSAYGRRGGIFGTIFATALLTVSIAYADASNRTWPVIAFAAGAVGVGLAITRLVERFGRPSLGPDPSEEEEWVPRTHSSTSNGWSTGRPYQSASTQPAVGGIWASDDAWGSG